ncbi:hypothetical protein MRB53_016437 [Persea americana]|uniref:Uncharacterized protein n=1 Tax=Persea americana TaxID=3435 RepID=A0ACC2M262_PERAE|nr:hypothetical protein MRB53_016437 [Persea americana]
MRTSLPAKKKYGFVVGTIPQPDEKSADLEEWWIVNSMLVSWIFNTIEPTLRSTITHMEIAKDLWDDIKERFSVGNGPQLANYDQNSTCQCGAFKCNLNAAFENKREEEKSIGYPDWWGDRPRTVSRGGGRSGQGGSTGGRGRGGVPRANVAQGLSAQPTIAAAQVTEDDQEGSGFSSEQWATLLNLLNS